MKSKQTTKECPLCGNTNLALFTSTNEKACNNHGDEILYIPWELDEGQIPIYANNRMKKIDKSLED